MHNVVALPRREDELMGLPDSLSIPIEGMTCASCVGRVERALKAVPGVTHASVNLATERADLAFDGVAPVEAVVAAIGAAGYVVPDETIELSIEGMTCASCVARIEKALATLPGVSSANVNLATERALVRHVAGVVPMSAMIAAVAGAGYTATPVTIAAPANSTDERRETEMAALRRSLAIATLFTAPLFAIEMGSHLIPAVHDWVMATVGHRESWLVQLVLASVVLFGPGWRFLAKGFPALLRGTPDMNALVALGTSAAWGYSAVATLAPDLLPDGTQHVYFEAAAMIVTLILLGRFLEARAKGQTSDAIRHLVGLQPRSARVVRAGVAVDVALADVVSGDLVQMRPGERVPVDGEVIEGHSFVDEAMITGEPIPVEKQPGATVVGGTINTTGAFTFRATQVGGDTVLAQIIRMVEQAQGAKLPIQALVDKVTAVFVPVVIGLALLTVAVWLIFGPQPALAMALVNGVAVLIIACPCAMGLATPTSIMVGTGRAAELGVLFRRGDALQALRDTRVVALDKTGTLTLGRPELTDLHPLAGFDEGDMLRLIAAVEARSEHPIGAAIVAAAMARGLELPLVTDFQSLPGHGLVATVNGRPVAIGSDRYMQALGHDVTSVRQLAADLASKGRSPLFAAIDGQLAALLAVADPIKPTTPQAVQALKALGLRVAMITGDNAGTARAIAQQIGIDEVVANVLPDGKTVAVQALREKFGPVAFVGDGINDAPALAEADVGIAIGTGTDIAIEAADVVLMAGDLVGVVKAIALSQATIRNIRQNLFWAFGYNAVLIPVAAGVLYPALGLLLSPVIAAGAMGLSSVFVLGNALRLRGFAPPAVAARTA